ncbi:MAG: TlyA family RNA methyltransferase [Azoarcus sp.]|jgi:23S rRNA (cytidine1920-2'-O)/16S rRNA (cytidine1409-2'-O)-methyltransferase|nr:TlyA family RNA methyltransferase [Azoarcus sp.]
MSMNSFHSRQTKPPPAARAAVAAARNPGRARVDVLLVRQGLAVSRTEAQHFIKAGRVSFNGQAISKPGYELPEGSLLTLAGSDEYQYVSRGGIKLAGALRESGLSAAGRVCLDVGQSTGGFTDCLLQAGAARVAGVDVGHGQLHSRLKMDARVASFEGINARTLSAADFGEAMPEGGFGLIVADLSFISLTLVLPQLPALLRADGDMLLLVKPQFEAGAGHIGKGGIVRDPAIYAEVERKLREGARASKLKVHRWFESPVTGGDGNHEFFLWATHEH